jgi:hypothetical protein
MTQEEIEDLVLNLNKIGVCSRAGMKLPVGLSYAGSHQKQFDIAS